MIVFDSKIGFMSVRVVDGDITASPEKYICHQCNCVTPRAKGLAQKIFAKFPWADTYSGRKENSTPGTIEITGNGSNERFVVNMFAQFSGGKPTRNETRQQRLHYFRSCLTQIKDIPNLETIAFPFNIGCGMAGGNWKDYEREIDNFAKDAGVLVSLYRFK
jgi:O-acetyl-ADP-ribose deacetylase (regulator of RNase III)